MDKITEWIDINKQQPKDFETVIWLCKGGKIEIGMYYGKDYCERIPPEHPLNNRSRKFYGKYGRWTEPAENGYVVVGWLPLDILPKYPKEMVEWD